MVVRFMLAITTSTVVIATQGILAQAPSLADVARREAERRKTVTEPSKVFTNDDVKHGLPLTTAAGPASPAGATAEAPPPAGESEAPKAAGAPPRPEGERDEAWWRKRMADLRDQLNRSRLFAEALQSRINALAADYTSRDDPAQRATIEKDRSEALSELERVRGEIARHEQAIADLDEEARKAAVPPGWLR